MVLMCRYTHLSISTLPLTGLWPLARTEGSYHAMRAYELMLIVNGSLEDSVAHSWINTVTKSIEGAGGTVHGAVDWWGKRKLAYPIKKQNDGYYAIFNVSAEGGALDDVERTLRIADDVLRHKLLRLPDSEAARRGLPVTTS